MQKILQLSLTDFRQILREQLLWVMFIVAPTAQFALARWLMPVAIDYFPVLNEYRYLLAGAMTLQVVAGIGFVVAMMLLDEKDEDVLTAIRVLPLGPEGFLTYRLLAATGIAVIFGFSMLYFSGLVNITFTKALAAAMLFAMMSPVVVLFMSTYGDNKVEGLAMYKGINIVLLLPIVSFFVPAGWKYFFGIIPDFWSFQFIGPATNVFSLSWLNFLIGLLLHVLLIGYLFVQFKRKVFQ
ncbi:MAG: hypothetical protein R2824_00930 [Saprospiraceae bacterium]|nr:hypothetical protein [Lewinella sp.]